MTSVSNLKIAAHTSYLEQNSALLAWVGLEAAECLDPWCPWGARGSDPENVLARQLCQCPQPLKIAITPLPREIRSGIVVYQEKPRTDCASIGPNYSLRISSLYLAHVSLPWLNTCRSVPPSREMPPQTITDPPPNLYCWTMLHTW